MNEKAITKFLAEEVMGWESMDDWSENPFVSNDSGAIFVDKDNEIAHLQFDPMNNIAHAFMVVEWMISEGQEYFLFGFDAQHDIKKEWIASFGITAEAPKACEAICFAAVRALGTDEQIKRLL